MSPVNINFFTPVKYENQPSFSWNNLREKVDDFFYLGGHHATVINEAEEVMLVDDKSARLCSNALKISLWCTGIFFVVPLIVKFALRYSHNFTIVDTSKKLLDSLDKCTSAEEVENAVKQGQDLEDKRAKINGFVNNVYNESYINDYKNQILEGIKRKEEIKDFHRNKGFTTESKGVSLNPDDLNFPDLNENQSKKLKKLITDMVDEINEQIEQNNATNVMEKRTIHINTSAPYKGERFYLMGCSIDPKVRCSNFTTDKEYYENATYLAHGVKELIKLGLVCKAEINGIGAILYV